MSPKRSEIAILDFGSQYTHLIARRIRELGVQSHIYPPETKASDLGQAWGIILSGGPKSVIRDELIPFDEAIFSLGVPILGLCYGHQLMGRHFGGVVRSGAGREYGVATIATSPSPLFTDVKQSTTVWMSHGDYVGQLPLGFVQIASTPNESITAMANEDKHLYGLQFHPEVTHSKEGNKMLANFVFTICQATKNWNKKDQLALLTEEILTDAQDKKVFLLVSGGVDSLVCFALLEKVLGKERVYGLHIDHGFMRHHETKAIVDSLKKLGFNNLHIYNAEREFFKALKGVSEPEQKRKIIGDLFLTITDRLMRQNKQSGDGWLLGQGTIYPDTIESGGTKNSVVIKTHHNRVPAIQELIRQGKIIEPIKELYKDEVRSIGQQLGLPKALVNRHPFPGPGLAIRLLCSEKTLKEKPELYTNNDNEKLTAYSLWKLPLKSVGVQGDERSYAHPGLLVPNQPAFTLQKALRLAPQLTNSYRDLNRVLFLISGDKKNLPSATVKKSFLTKPRTALLQKIDFIVRQTIADDGLEKKIWQFPVVLVPFGHRYGESVVLRPVQSAEAMTIAAALLPPPTITKILNRIKRLKTIDYIFYDLTNKPPGTIEWE